jgi:lipopolysaccharide transport system ATP-binding protein
MSEFVVRAEGVGKKYVIGHRGAYGYVALRDVLAAGPGNMARRLAGRRERSSGGSTREEIWAVRDVSFDLVEGDRLGLIGRNGAGKSTLLKILSRITEPSAGRVRIRGRVASLMEVGTGFHPELTGRENVFLNGTILGMRRAEIQRKFDEIVAFSEVEKFLDTPVKRYSSGMYVRLAFAVAAHLEQEILLVDEVLAVGDAAFQKKCLSKMGQVAREGRTVVFVSHNLVAIEQLCTTALWIGGGSIVELGKASDVVAHYNASFAASAAGTFSPSAVRGDGSVELTSYMVTNAVGSVVPIPVTGEDVLIQLRVHVRERIQRLAMDISIESPTGVLLTNINTTAIGQELGPWEPGDRTVTIRLGSVAFMPGAHRVGLSMYGPDGRAYVDLVNGITFEIGQSALFGTTYIDSRYGCVYTKIDVATDSSGSAAPEPVRTQSSGPQAVQ